MSGDDPQNILPPSFHSEEAAEEWWGRQGVEWPKEDQEDEQERLL